MQAHLLPPREALPRIPRTLAIIAKTEVETLAYPCPFLQQVSVTAAAAAAVDAAGDIEPQAKRPIRRPTSDTGIIRCAFSVLVFSGSTSLQSVSADAWLLSGGKWRFLRCWHRRRSRSYSVTPNSLIDPVFALGALESTCEFGGLHLAGFFRGLLQFALMILTLSTQRLGPLRAHAFDFAKHIAVALDESFEHTKHQTLLPWIEGGVLGWTEKTRTEHNGQIAGCHLVLLRKGGGFGQQLHRILKNVLR
mmetsp:Transcript_18930/g.48143  ORF Transcript_18930/g.48143 Transcript_18930/m.48143 type:complete len:249 (-) Transcript_18930:1306-2052(-)